MSIDDDLKCIMCTHDGVILWDMVTDLASLELIFSLEMKDNIAWDASASAMEK